MVFKSLPIHKLIEELIYDLKSSVKAIPEEDRWKLGYNSIELCTKSQALLDKINMSRNEVKLRLIEEIKVNLTKLRCNPDTLKSKYNYKMTIIYERLNKVYKLISEWELSIKEIECDLLQV